MPPSTLRNDNNLTSILKQDSHYINRNETIKFETTQHQQINLTSQNGDGPLSTVKNTIHQRHFSDNSIHRISTNRNMIRSVLGSDERPIMLGISDSLASQQNETEKINQITNNSLDNNHHNHTDKIQSDSWNYSELYNYLKIENMYDLFRLTCSLAVIFGGLIPYIPQYIKIKQTNNSDGFSTYVCLTLLLANILRILFFLGHPFELPLLVQSFVMIGGMLAMMEICVRVKRNSSLYNIAPINSINPIHPRNRNRRIGSPAFDEGFWDWTNFFSYIKFLVLFTIMMGSLTLVMIDNQFYVESLGFVAILTEAMLGMPQVLRNFKKKSTAGMSIEMVVMWLSGDIFKTIYFLVRQTPTQFYVCGSIQVIVDILILCQVLWYKRPNVSYWSLPKSG